EVAPAPLWKPLPPAGPSPSPRTDSSAIIDVGSRMVAFGGSPTGCTPLPTASLNETWVLKGLNGVSDKADWVQLIPSNSPPPGRRRHTAVYNPTSNRMIIFGGDPTGCGQSKYNDVWVLTNANGFGGAPTWLQLAPIGAAPPARSDHAAIYDRSNNRM